MICCFLSLSCVRLFVTPGTAACKAFLSFTFSWSLLKLMSIKSVMPSNHLIHCHPLLLPLIFPSNRVFPMSQLFISDGQRIGVLALASVLLMNIQGWFPLGLTGLILLCKGLSEVFSSTTVWKHWFFDAQPSLWSSFHTCTWLLEKKHFPLELIFHWAIIQYNFYIF